MDIIDVLDMRIIDVINRPVTYKNGITGRKRKARILKIEERGAIVIRRGDYIVWVPWEELEWAG